MPRKYKRKRYRKKRYGKRRYKKKTYTVGISNGLGLGVYSPLSRVLKASFKYSDRFDLDVASANVPDVRIFAANGMTVVDITGSVSAHQPRGFDQLVSVLYDHYTVIATSASVTFSNTTDVQSALCGISVRDASTPEVLVNPYMEDSRTRFSTCAGREAGGNTKTIKINLNSAKFLGLPKPILGNSDLKGNAAVNPAELAFFHVWMGGMSAAPDLNC